MGKKHLNLGEEEIISKKKVDVWRYKKYLVNAKTVDISAGKNIIILNEDEAREHDIYLGYRTKVKYKNREIAVLVDTSNSSEYTGKVGLFKEVADELGLKDSERIEIIHMNRPKSIQYIKNKLDGEVLSGSEIETIIHDLMKNRLGEVELSAWVSAVYTHGLSDTEVVNLTNSIVNSGDILDLGVKVVADKHCIGGVAGNRTTMLIVPIIAAAGIHIPKSSSRAITSAAGTADVMEMLAPVDLEMDELKRVVLKSKGAIVWGGGLNLASADDKLIQVRNPLRLDPEGMLLSSILAKKKAVGATHVVIDIPMGRGAKIQDLTRAKSLAKHFIKVGEKGLGMDVESLITDGSEPVGNGVGVSLEARDVLRVLEGNKLASEDLKHKSCLLAGKLLELTKKVKAGMGYSVAMKFIDNGKALKKFKQIVSLQGGDDKISSKKISPGNYSYTLKSGRDGRIYHIDSKVLSKIARLAGAPKDYGAGIYLHVLRGDNVKLGDKLLTVYSESEAKLGFVIKALDYLEPIEMRKFILGILD